MITNVHNDSNSTDKNNDNSNSMFKYHNALTVSAGAAQPASAAANQADELICRKGLSSQ